MTRDEAAAAFDETATLLELHGEEVFKVAAYRNAGRALESLSLSLDELVAGGLKGVRGIGASLAAKLGAMSRDGRSVELDDLRAKTPEGLLKMLRIGGLGPKKVRALHVGLGITTLAELQAACEAGTVASQKGFGAKTQAKILEGIKFLEVVGQRVRFDKAQALGVLLLDRIKGMPGVIRAELGGSLRRRRETAKDIDILVSADDSKPIMDAFVTLPEVLQVTGHGDTKSSIVARLDLGGQEIVLNSDLRVVKDEAFAVALVHFTGSKDHNKRLRQTAIDKGWLLNEYGLTGPGAPASIASEADVYHALGLEWVPPEMREDTGEVEASAAKSLPTLVTVGDIRGVFHNHTTYSDGANTLEEMVAACRELGLSYYGTGDHSQSLKVANGLPPAAVRKQWAEADRINARLKGSFRVFKGTECDILKDGSLDYDDDLLAGFDYVVGSVHTYFNLDRDEQTERICKALRHPRLTMLGHATGRLLTRRDGYPVDLDKVIEVAADHGKMIEINAQPARLDLDWQYVKKAKRIGVMIVINPDAHSAGDLGLYRYGLDVARRGWLEGGDVFNTRSADEVAAEFDRRRR